MLCLNWLRLKKRWLRWRNRRLDIKVANLEERGARLAVRTDSRK